MYISVSTISYTLLAIAAGYFIYEKIRKWKNEKEYDDKFYSLKKKIEKQIAEDNRAPSIGEIISMITKEILPIKERYFYLLHDYLDFVHKSLINSERNYYLLYDEIVNNGNPPKLAVCQAIITITTRDIESDMACNYTRRARDKRDLVDYLNDQLEEERLISLNKAELNRYAVAEAITEGLKRSKK